MNHNTPVTVSMTAGEWGLICTALRTKADQIGDAIGGMPNPQAADQLIIYQAKFDHIHDQIRKILLRTHDDEILNDLLDEIRATEDD